LPKSFPKAELAAAVGASPARWKSVRGGGYGTNTSKWSVDLDDGRRVFVKLALDEVAAGWLRSEANVYGAVSTSFVPAFVAWHDANDDTFLVLEDLTAARRPAAAADCAEGARDPAQAARSGAALGGARARVKPGVG